MRERLTLAFVVLTVLLLLGAGVVRSFVLRDLVRQQEAGHLRQEAHLVATVVQEEQTEGGVVDGAFLRDVVDPMTQLEYRPASGDPVVVRGGSFDADTGADDLMRSSAAAGSGTVTISQSPEVVRDLVGRDLGSIAALFLLIAVIAGLVGFLVASALSSPFQRLAVAAGALGRGRFDLDLPRTRVPEARAIADALRSSARQLEDRVQRERDFAEHASHVLRTPLTGMRLELEDLTLRDDVRPDVKEAARRSLDAVEEVGRVAAELVDLSRRGALVEGSQLPLVDLATQLAQRWADRLGVRHRTLTAAAEGDLSLTYTPGPVEQVTDLLLADVVRRGSGAVRIVFQGADGGHLRIRVESAGRAGSGHGAHGADGVAGDPPDRVEDVRAAATALGGRVTGDHPADGVEVLLPRR